MESLDESYSSWSNFFPRWEDSLGAPLQFGTAHLHTHIRGSLRIYAHVFERFRFAYLTTPSYSFALKV